MISNTLDFCVQMYRAQSILGRRFNFHGLGFSDFIILLQLNNAPDGRLRRVDLADKLGVTASSVTRNLLPLEKIGLVTREPDARDARVAYAAITKAGQNLLEESLVTAERISQEMIPDTPDESLLEMKKLFSRF